MAFLVPSVCVLVYVLALLTLWLPEGSHTLKGTEAVKEIKSEVLAPRGITNATVDCPAKTDIRDHRNTVLGFPLVGQWLRTKIIECSVRSAGSEGTVTATAGPVSTVAPIGGGYGGATTVPVPGVGEFKANVRDIQVDLMERNAQEHAPRLSQLACPSTSKPRKGATFFCTAKIPGGGFGVVIVDQTSEDSKVEVRALVRTLRSRRAATDAALRESSRSSGRSRGR